MKKRKVQAQRAKTVRGATTADVLAVPAARKRIPRKWKEHWDQLVQLREEILRRKEDLARDAQSEQPAFSLHMADAGTDNYDRDFAYSMLSSEQNALYEIEQALNRIKNGSYGICELSGKPIEAARLKAIPWTRFSAQAEKNLEKQGVADRAKLSPLESISKSPRPAPGEEEEEEEE